MRCSGSSTTRLSKMERMIRACGANADLVRVERELSLRGAVEGKHQLATDVRRRLQRSFGLAGAGFPHCACCRRSARAQERGWSRPGRTASCIWRQVYYRSRPQSIKIDICPSRGPCPASGGTRTRPSRASECHRSLRYHRDSRAFPRSPPGEFRALSPAKDVHCSRHSSLTLDSTLTHTRGRWMYDTRLSPRLIEVSAQSSSDEETLHDRIRGTRSK